MTNRNDEIRVDRREGVPWWVWAIVVVLIALLAWWLLTMNNSGTVAPSTPPATSPTLSVPSGSPASTTAPDASASPSG